MDAEASGEWVEASYGAIRGGEVFEFRNRPGGRYVCIPGAMLYLDPEGGEPSVAYLSKSASEIRFTGERVRFVVEPIATESARLPDALPEIER